MKRITGAFLGICLAVITALSGMSLPARAASGSISLSVSASTVNIGDTITVTVNGSADVAALIQVNVSCSGGAEYTGSGNSAAILEPSAGGSDSSSLTYRATSPGTVTFSASVVEAYAVETAEGMSIGGASASVTVNNAAGGGDGGGGGNSGGDNGGGSGGGGSSNGGNGGGTGNSGSNGADNTSKSADNSLKSLTISPGTLSPAFKYSTTKYTASVPSDVTSVAVDAQVSNSKASVESVTGNTDLKPGENTIKIVVKAENGTIATYTILVNRGGAAPEDPDEEPGEEEPDAPLPETGITINGRSYKVSAAFPESIQLPEEFEKGTASYEGEEVEVYSFSNGGLKLYYLNEEVPEGTEGGHDGCYFYNEGANTFFPYINIPVGNSYVIVLPSSYNAGGTAPEGYEAAGVAFGEFSMEGFQLSSLYTEGIEGAGDFYLVYGVNRDGTSGWYQYDSVEGSLQRFVQLGSTEPQEEEEPPIDEEKYQKDYQEMKDKYQKEKNRAQMMLGGLVLVVVVAVIAIINILVFGRRGRGSRRKKEKDQDMDFIDFDDL